MKKNIEIRLPKISDLQMMWEYINKISKERTFIRFQGEEISLKEEEEFLISQIEKIKNHTAVLLMLLIDDKLAGVSGIMLKDKIESHVGVFGITIDEDFRGQGFGYKLMGAVIDEAVKNIPVLEIITLVCYEENQTARKLYEKFGFKEYGNLPKGIKRASGYSNHLLMYKVIK